MCSVNKKPFEVNLLYVVARSGCCYSRCMLMMRCRKNWKPSTRNAFILCTKNSKFIQKIHTAVLNILILKSPT